MTTLEQAARAAAERAGYDWDRMPMEYSPNYLGPQHDIRHARRWWIENQRAAFHAVREPSESMIAAGAKAEAAEIVESGSDLSAIWRAEIDAILTEGET